jgi:signal transduction histidine kinase
MMRTIGVFLLYVAVALRGVVIFADDPRLPVVIGCFGVYGLLLFFEPWITRPNQIGFSTWEDLASSFTKVWRTWIYLFLQSALVIALMAVPEPQDFFALLFVPLSMQVVLSFGRRVGNICIAIYSLIIILLLLGSEDGSIFGIAMGAFFSGMCFLFGGYAYQVQKAEMARNQNRETFNELQTAHRQLQGYADQVASLAIEQERNRLARNLHDSVTQTVFSMNLAAQSASLLLDKEPSSSSNQLLRLEELAASALSEIQTLVSQLRPRSVAEEGLPNALRRMAAERQEREGLHVSLHISGDKLLSETEAVGLYSIAYEALTNVIKHSGVLEATVRLDLDADGSYLEIEDRGLGFNPHAAVNQREHLGMTGMSEQANEIGWELSIESYPHQGTRIRVSEKQSGGPE